MAAFQPDIPPHVAEIIRHLPPDVKRSIRQALRALSVAPEAGEPLRRELEGLWKYRVRRFRIIYAIDRDHRLIRIVAVGHRRGIYEEAAEQRRQPQLPQ
jgi:mRNA interferase RelE/StbE